MAKRMTVRQLVKKLQDMPQDLAVAMSSAGNNPDEIGTGFVFHVTMLEDGPDKLEHGDDVVLLVS